MMNQKNFLIIAGSIGALLGGMVALLSYVNMKQHREFLKRNAMLENEIKKLQLIQLKEQVTGEVPE
jgi:hypothetical protein